MDIVVGVYGSHKEAVTDLQKLKVNGFEMESLSLLGKAGEEEMQLCEEGAGSLETITKSPIKDNPILSSILIGSMVGLLTGAGLFFIPGLGVLYGAGALVGIVTGFDFGLLGGGIADLLTAKNIKDDYGKHYEDLVAKGKHILIAHGTTESADLAKGILHTQGLYI